ncbi:acyl carrier protein [Streptomyces sp. NPDC059802]|uniref:acyl carrier protein n=1 Tax=Streptomyces sp. NPDC059802 TaxID=3346952 RepID=UPI00365B40F7
MITLENVKDIVAECLNMRDEPVSIDLDSPFMVDSFTLVWILHLMEERYDFEIAPEQLDGSSFTSVRTFHEYLAKEFPDRVSLEG